MKKFFNKLFKYFKILLLVALIALIIKSFAFDAFKIPSASMEGTLLPGDFIFASKLAYNFSTPREIPIINFPIPHANIFNISKPKVNDVVIFQFPHGFENDSLRSDLKYVKRIVAGPHDTLKISNGEIVVNGKKEELPSTVQTPQVKNGSDLVYEDNIYPPGTKWNRFNYGPLVVPAKGDTIKITPHNFDRWHSVIVLDYGERALIEEGSVVTLAGRSISEYILKQDCYFVMGDNSSVSLDSRQFGFITDDMILGKALFIYWSYEPTKIAPGPLGFLSAIRARRIFKFIE